MSEAKKALFGAAPDSAPPTRRTPKQQRARALQAGVRQNKRNYKKDQDWWVNQDSQFMDAQTKARMRAERKTELDDRYLRKSRARVARTKALRAKAKRANFNMKTGRKSARAALPKRMRQIYKKPQGAIERLRAPKRKSSGPPPLPTG